MKPYLSLVFNKYNLNIDAFSCCILFDSLRLSAKFSRETATRRHNTFKIANCKQRSITQAVVVDARTVIVRAIRCKRSANSLHEQRVWRVTRGGQVRVETSMTVSTTVVATAFININGVFRRCKRRGGRTKRKIMPTVTSQHPIRAGGHLPAPFRERVLPSSDAKSSFASDYAWFRKQRFDSRYDRSTRPRALGPCDSIRSTKIWLRHARITWLQATASILVGRSFVRVR